MKMKTRLLSAVLALASSAMASQITNSVDIASNVLFDLIRPEDGRPLSQLKSDEVVDFCVGSPSTNVLYLRKFPYGSFDFHLFDDKGEEVSKTQAGLNLTRTPPKPTKDDLRFWRTSHFAPFMVGGGAAYFAPLFRPDDVFTITNKGVYELEVRTRLCVIMTNGMPDLKAMADGLNASLRCLPFVNNFGVLTSPPLRVKVIKE
jgi:hypothetical protein